jgi:hypothetical protein
LELWLHRNLGLVPQIPGRHPVTGFVAPGFLRQESTLLRRNRFLSGNYFVVGFLNMNFRGCGLLWINVLAVVTVIFIANGFPYLAGYVGEIFAR